MSKFAAGSILTLVMVSTCAGQTFPEAQAAAKPKPKIDSLRNRVPQRWWETASSLCRIALKSIPADARGNPAAKASFPIGDEAKASALLDEMMAQGCDAISLGDPAETAGRVYPSLATKDHYRVAPEIGTMDDFRRLVRLIHSKGLAVTINYNLGYSSLEADHFLKACDDVRAGRDSKEARWFLWSDRSDAPPPTITTDTFFMVRPMHLPGAMPGTFYDPTKSEVWEYSERAGRYFWSKWNGIVDGKMVRLPQYNWMSLEFQEEAEKITRFWMETGLDGMMQDAVNWYVGYTWEKGRRRIADVIAGYGNTWRLPEGAGGFHEDPVAWIADGGWNTVQDYALGTWWVKGSNVILSAITSGDPRGIERALRNYHDRVVLAGGTLYFEPLRMMADSNPLEQRLAMATAVLVGNLISLRSDPPVPADPEMQWLLKTKRAHPEFHNLGVRRHVPTNADQKYYAFLRAAKDGSERALAVMNFQNSPQTVEVDLSGVATTGVMDLKTNTAIPRQNPFKLELPAYGYRLFLVNAPPKLP